MANGVRAIELRSVINWIYGIAYSSGVSKPAMAVTEIAKRMECGESSPHSILRAVLAIRSIFVYVSIRLIRVL